MDSETIQILLDLLNPLHGEIDRQTYDEKVAANFDAPADAEYTVEITARMERDLHQAVCILENRKTEANGDAAELRLPQAMTPAINDALGIMNFHSGPIAHAFRAAGFQIKPKCEDEQAFVLFWALGLAIKHGDEWRKFGAERLKELKDGIDKKSALVEQAALAG